MYPKYYGHSVSPDLIKLNMNVDILIIDNCIFVVKFSEV
jgi:hypothetical protein